MTDKAVTIVYRNHEGVVKEYRIIPNEGSFRFDFPWTRYTDSPGAFVKTWIFDAIVIKSPDNVTRTFTVEKILEWKP